MDKAVSLVKREDEVKDKGGKEREAVDKMEHSVNKEDEGRDKGEEDREDVDKAVSLVKREDEVKDKEDVDKELTLVKGEHKARDKAEENVDREEADMARKNISLIGQAPVEENLNKVMNLVQLLAMKCIHPRK